ncbi:ABC transporter ATP-binding protein [Eubacterium xylanophilum]|uniref:ABC transporter ATP-binding protein n=1 Tax=Eubacterium xylanophilum TaxID=39497 RepID=UPI00047DEA91|nr:ABC transporter ATP-binding protein [Eubacterium xylanophilum]
MKPIVECKNVTKKYGNLNALDDVSFKIQPGSIVGLLGPNGSGKTTMIKLINSLIKPEEGEVLVDGMEPGVESKKIVSYLPDRMYFDDYMKVRELMAYYKDFYEDFNERKAIELLDDLRIDVDAKIKTLSKGTKEKVQLIMVMSRDAKLYVLDEPIGGVDPAARDYILNTIINNYAPDSAILISTHLIGDIEKILDDCLFIQNGKLVLHKTVEEIRIENEMSVDEMFREVFRC